MNWRAWVADRARLTSLAARQLAGRRFWLVPLAVLAWPAFQALRLAVGWQESRFLPEAAQGSLIGAPLAVLAAVLGVRIIAGEIDRRTLEIAYTVPGGAHRVWTAKLTAAVGLVLAAEAVLALVAFALFTAFPASALYGAFQGAAVYLALALALSTWFRSEVAGLLATTVILFMNGLITGWGESQLRVSPFWNPAAVDAAAEPAEILAWTIQNRIGMTLLFAALIALSYARAERRERLLG